MERFLRAGSANSDRGLSGGSVRPQPKMAGMRRADEQTSASEPHSDIQGEGGFGRHQGRKDTDRKSTRLNSSHANISYAVFCLKKDGDQPAGRAVAFIFRELAIYAWQYQAAVQTVRGGHARAEVCGLRFGDDFFFLKRGAPGKLSPFPLQRSLRN